MNAGAARRHGTIDSGGLALFYQEWGAADAPPVVLLHGLRAYGQWFEEFCDAAADRFRLIALDQRGRGRSAWAGAGGYTTDHYVADLHALVTQLGLPRCAFLGHSMGGVNVAHYAASHPERVQALVIVDIAPEFAPEGLARIRAELGRTPASFGSRDEARAFLATIHPRATARSLATRLEWMLVRGDDGRYGWRIDPKIFDPNMRPDPPERLWQALAAIRCPTLLVRGAITDLVTRECAERVVATLAAGELVEIPGAGHMVVEDNPRDFSAAVVPFLARAIA
jgi:pimeloyl-ACP methyl ester carboxylesterase